MLEDSLIHLLHRASQVAEAHYAREQKSIDITPGQFVVLAAIDEEADQSQTKLVERCGVDRSTMTDVVGGLRSTGWFRGAARREMHAPLESGSRTSDNSCSKTPALLRKTRKTEQPAN